MSAGAMTWVAFGIVCLLILTMPFVPAFREWNRPTDRTALPVSANYTSDIDHFARRLRADAAACLGKGVSTGYEEFDDAPSPGDAAGWAIAQRRMLSTEGIASEDAIRSRQPLFVQGDLEAGATSVFPAVYATGDLTLGAESVVHDWAHADGVLHLAERSVALRRISAGKKICLGDEAWFERVQAPSIYFGQPTAPTPTWRRAPASDPAIATASYADLPDPFQQTPLQFLFRGNCALEAGKIYCGSLVVNGYLVIGAGATVFGNIKAREGVSVGVGATVMGAITCENRIFVLEDSRTLGPVISETDILVGAGALIGLPDAQTTLSARNIVIEQGALVHGSVWAHEVGMVRPS